jgi:hypothetical protein
MFNETKRISLSVGQGYVRWIIIGLFLLIFTASPAVAQTNGKRPLEARDFDTWKSVRGEKISPDGNFTAYVMHPQDGNGELVVRNVATGKEWRSPRGYRPAVPRPNRFDPAAVRAFAAQGRLLSPIFSADSKFLFFTIEPNRAEIRKAKRSKKKPADFPKKSLGIMDLETGKLIKIDRVKNYRVPEDGAGFVAYLKEPVPEKKEK